MTTVRASGKAVASRSRRRRAILHSSPRSPGSVDYLAVDAQLDLLHLAGPIEELDARLSAGLERKRIS